MKAAIRAGAYAALACAAGVATAQPTAERGPEPGTEPVEPLRPMPPGQRCAVHLVRAPAELATAIEARLVALHACEVRLDVYIVATGDGLYVNARDDLGRVRERIVPDAEIAAALIASWVEVAAVAPLVGVPAVAPPLAAMPEPPATAFFQSGAPDADLVEPEPSDGDRPAGAARTVGLTVFAGMTTGGMTTGGATLDHDFFEHEGVSMALMLSFTRDVSSSYYVVRWDDDFFKETGRWGGAALLELHHRFGTGRWRLTPSIAFGLGTTQHEFLTVPEAPVGEVAMPVMTNESSFGPRIAASLALGIRVSQHVDLELTAGWMFSGYNVGAGVDPSDQAIVGGIGLRHDR